MVKKEKIYIMYLRIKRERKTLWNNENLGRKFGNGLEDRRYGPNTLTGELASHKLINSLIVSGPLVYQAHWE